MLTKLLKDTVQYNYLRSNKNIIHIGYGIDNNFSRCVGSSIASFIQNNPKKNFTFHIICSSLSKDNHDKFQLLAKNLFINIIIYEINPNLLSNLPIRSNLPISMYFRFILPVLLKDIEKIIYIDADTLCLKSIDDLLSINLNNTILGAIIDIFNKKRNLLLQKSSQPYFLSGMLIINIKEWNKYNMLNKLFNIFSKDTSSFHFPDQDALNIILINKVKFIDLKYNYCHTLIQKEPYSNIFFNNQVIILHFNGFPKPWNLAYYQSSRCNKYTINLYKKYENLTPWKNTPLIAPKNYKEMRFYAKDLWLNRHYLKSLQWHIKYLITKIHTKYID